MGLPCPRVTPLTRMVDWVSWPLGKNVDKWIVALLKGLAAVKKFSILIEVSLAKIEKVGGPWQQCRCGVQGIGVPVKLPV